MRKIKYLKSVILIITLILTFALMTPLCLYAFNFNIPVGNRITYSEMVNIVNSGGSANKLEITFNGITSNNISFTDTSIIINSYPNSSDVQSFIKNSLSNSNASVSIYGTGEQMLTGSSGDALGNTSPSPGGIEYYYFYDSYIYSNLNWNVYMNGSQYVAEVTISADSVRNNYSIYSTAQFSDGSASITKKYNVVLPEPDCYLVASDVLKFSSSNASFSDSSVTLSSYPTDSNIETFIEKTLNNTNITYSVYSFYPTEGYKTDLNSYTTTASQAGTKWNVYKSGLGYKVDITLVINNVFSTNMLPSSATINGVPDGFKETHSIIKSFDVYFANNTVIPTGLFVEQGAPTIKVGETLALDPTVFPANSIPVSFKCISSNSSVVSVDSKGNIKGLKAGKAVITITEPVSGYSVTSSVLVEEDEVLPESISLSQSTLKLKEKETASLLVYFNPKNVDDDTITWSSSDSAVAKVDSNGIVTAVKAGTAIITAKTINNKTATCTITVDEIKPEKVTLNKSTLTLTIGKNETLKATILPDNATDKTLTWSSNNTSVATVDKNGKVTAVKAGNATITVKTVNGKTATCTVTVGDIKAEKVSLNKSSAKVYVGETVTLTATINPEDTTDKTLTWSTSKSSVATVDKNGKVTGVKAGTATITVKTVNGKSASCTVTVDDVQATSVTLNNSTLSVKKGSSATLTATIAPKNTADKTLTWSTSNSAVATVSGGKVTGVKAGTATITVKTKNGKSATCKVTVTEDVLATSISLNKTELTLDKGYSATLTATIAPTNVTDKTVTWSTSDSSVATVSGGKITAVKGGTATITAKTANGKTATCTVNVFEEILPETFKVNNPSISIEEGKTAIIGYTLLPANSTNKKITWTSSDSSVVSVNGTRVTGLKPGTATITGKTVNGLTATCTVKVKEKTVSITVPSTITAYVGDTVDFSGTTTINPADVTVDKLTWTSSKTNVGTVSGPKFTAKAPGMTYVTAKYGEKSSTCTVIVKSAEDKILDSVTGISINPSSVKEEVGYTKNLAVTISPSTVKASDLDIIWTSSDLSTVYVTSGGQITLKKAGTATITASLANGQKATCTVTATEPDTTDYSEVYATLVHDNKTVYINMGDTIKLDYYLSDPDADESKVKLKWRLNPVWTNDGPVYSTNIILNDDGSITAIDADSVSISLITIGSDGTELLTPEGYSTRSTCQIVVKLNEAQWQEKRMAFANEVLRLCNIEREKAGVAPLQLMDELNFIAQIRADELTEYGSISINGGHYRPDGTKWTTVFQNVSVKKRAWGENLIQNYGTPESVVHGWMTCPGHKANILRENFTHMGIGVTFNGSSDCTESYIVSQIFIESNE